MIALFRLCSRSILAAAVIWCGQATLSSPFFTVEAKPAKVQKKQPFSGLIVDCRGLRLVPAMSPAILSETGEELYLGPKVKIDPMLVFTKGVVSYSRSLQLSKDSQSRVGKNPLKLKAIRAKSSSANLLTDAIISKKDAQILLKENQKQKFLAQLGVVFIID